MIGIVGYGAYVPCYRIRTDDIAHQWGQNPESVKQGLALREKTVPGMDEDTITISAEAGRHALARAGVDPHRIGALYVGSESHPYAVKPSGTVVAAALGIGPNVHVADFEFACKAGTEAMYCAYSHVKSGEMPYALAIGADTSQGAPGDPLEYSASAGGAAFVMGKERVLAEIEHTGTFSSDTPDFWRREGRAYPHHGGRYTGSPSYFRHIEHATHAIMERSGLKTSDFRYVIFHMPNGKFPLAVGKNLGFSREQLDPGYLVPRMGNTYSGSSPCGLAAALDVADPGDRVLLTSFGSGAGSDAFVFRCTDELPAARSKAPSITDLLDGRRNYLSYAQYAKYRDKYLLNT